MNTSNNSVKLIWATPDAEELLAYMARVSNPKHQDKPAGFLIKYLIDNHHWSPFEMVNLCVEINTTREIARQILRHRSFSFQEFSQRYAEVSLLPEACLKEARLQDPKNRQSSIEVNDELLQEQWVKAQLEVVNTARSKYEWALRNGIAKEVARSVLPEGLTTSRMYMNGTLRSWIHFLNLRSGNGTQKETQEVAQMIKEIIEPLFPVSFKALVE